MEDPVGESSFGEFETRCVFDSLEKATQAAQNSVYGQTRVLELEASKEYQNLWYLVHRHESRYYPGEEVETYYYRIRKMQVNEDLS